MHQSDPARNKIHITVILRVPGRNVNDDPEWKERCELIYCDLRAYLMGARKPADRFGRSRLRVRRRRGSTSHTGSER